MIQKLLIGFIASIGISVIGLLARITGIGPFPAEKLYNTVTFWMGTPAMFQLVHKLLGFGQAGKIAAFMGVLLGWVGGLALRPSSARSPWGSGPPLVCARDTR